MNIYRHIKSATLFKIATTNYILIIQPIFIFLGLIFAAFIIHGSAIDNWWSYDDTQILKHAFLFSPYEYFFIPEAWRALIPFSFTPWLTLSYDLDLALFGFDPKGFYIHNLLTIGLCAYLFYLIAGQWLKPGFAIGGALLFLIGPPIVLAAQQLMVRHYIEGMLFYLLSLCFILKSLRTGNTQWYGGLAGFTFAMATAAKEIYLPLGFIAFLLPIGSLRERLFAGWPILLVMALYVPWRWFMLGDPIGGYTPIEALPAVSFSSMLSQFKQIPNSLLTNFGVLTAGIIFIYGFFLLIQDKQWYVLVFTLIICILLAMPLLPLAVTSSLVAERFFIATWTTFVMVLSIILNDASQKKHLRIVSFFLFGILFVSAYQKSNALYLYIQKEQNGYFSQGNKILNSSSNDIIFLFENLLPHYSLGLLDLRKAMNKELPVPSLVSDESQFLTIELDEKNIWRYDAQAKAMVDITENIQSVIEVWQEKLKPLLLKINIRYDLNKKFISWDFQSPEAGDYIYISRSRLQVGPQGTVRMESPPSGCFRIRLNAFDGSVAYTPLLSLLQPIYHEDSLELSWEGKGDMFENKEEVDCGK